MRASPWNNIDRAGPSEIVRVPRGRIMLCARPRHKLPRLAVDECETLISPGKIVRLTCPRHGGIT
jgi:hypothetical protein